MFLFFSCAGEMDQVDTPDIGIRNDHPLLTQPYKRLQHNAPHWWQLWAAIFYKKLMFLLNEWKYAICMVRTNCYHFYELFLMHTTVHNFNVLISESKTDKGLRKNVTKCGLYCGFRYIYGIYCFHN